MNQLVQVGNTTTALPAHIAAFQNLFGNIGQNVVGGVKTGGHPRISIKQSRWRLQEGADEEVVQSLTLDVMIVGANPSMSKVWYAGAYDPKATEFKAPDCFSDNGVGPSATCEKPQCATCTLCPNNVWGSKVSTNGKKTKACADYKKLAVVLAHDADAPVYELRVPPASIGDLARVMQKMVNNGIPVPAVIFQLSFDPSADHPKIVFNPLGYANEQQLAVASKWVNSAEVTEAINDKDQVKQGLQVSAPLAQAAPPLLAMSAIPAFLQATPQPVQAAPMPTEEPVKKTRRRTVTGGVAQVQTPVQAAPAPQQGVFDMPGVQNAATATQLNPQVTDAALDAILGDALS